MNIVFEKVVISGFKSFLDGEHTLDFTELQPGLHFMRGKNLSNPRLGANGAGKSTVWHAITWCLFGKTINGLRNTDIAAWNGAKRSFVTLTLKVGKQRYEIYRATHPNRFIIGGTDAGPEAVEKLLGMNFDLFCHTILFGQDEDLFFDLQPNAKMQLFTDVLNLEIWDERSKAASKETAELEGRLTRAEGELAGYQASVLDMEAVKKTAEESVAEWDAEQKERRQVASTKLRAIRKDLEAVRKKHGEADLAYDSNETSLREVRDELRKLNRSLQEAISDKAKAQRPLQEAQGSYAELEKQIKKFGAGDICPVCGQKAKGTTFAAHVTEVKDRARDLKLKIGKGIDPSFDTNIKRLQGKITEYEALEKTKRAAADTAQSQLNVLTQSVNELVMYERDQQKILDDTTENPHRRQLMSVKGKLKGLKADIETVKDDIATLERRITRSSFWVKGFKDVRLFIIEEVLQQLELTTNSALDEIGLVGWRVKYATEKENKSGTVTPKLNVSIISPDNPAEVRWEVWSGGEGQRLRLVGALALSEVLLNYAGVNTNLEILDEPTRSLSVEGTYDLTDYLADRARQLGRITFYVDHMSMESTRFTSIVNVVKDKKGSHFA